mgnify:CR=1 FL=1
MVPGGMTLDLAVAALVAVGLVFTVAYTFVTGISPVPTNRRVRATLLAALPARVEGTIFELGSGWGTLAFPLARRYPGFPVEAYELSPVPWAFSRLRAFLTPYPNLTIHRRNFHRASLSAAALVVCYLYPGGHGSPAAPARSRTPRWGVGGEQLFCRSGVETLASAPGRRPGKQPGVRIPDARPTGDAALPRGGKEPPTAKDNSADPRPPGLTHRAYRYPK